MDNGPKKIPFKRAGRLVPVVRVYGLESGCVGRCVCGCGSGISLRLGPNPGNADHLLKDFDLAEDYAQEAFAAALDKWPVSGVPDSPRAWIVQTARHKAIDRLRRRTHFEEKIQPLLTAGTSGLEEPGFDSQEIPDERLRLMFTCCHPALSRRRKLR